MTQMVSSNLRGTVHTSFKIHNSGPIIYQGDAIPSPGASYQEGDLFIQHSNQGKLYQYKGNQWIETGQTAQQNFNIVGGGNAFTSMNVLHGETTSANQGELYFDGAGGSQVLTLPSDSVSLIEADFVGINIDNGIQYSAGYNLKGVVTNFLGNIQFTNNPAEQVYAESNDQWIVEMIPGTAGSNSVRFLAYGENNRTIKWTVFARATVSTFT